MIQITSLLVGMDTEVVSAVSFHPDHPEWRVYSSAEEIVNCVTHGAAAPAAIYLTLSLMRRLGPGVEPRVFWALIVYGMSLFFVFTASALYHGFFRRPAIKRMMQYADHVGIFLMIAGSYTPFACGPLWAGTGLRVLIFAWVTALVGIVGKLFFFEWFLKISLPYFLGMGWAAIFAVRDMIKTFPVITIVYLAAAGISYTAGCRFFVRDAPYDHALFHICVLLGCAFMHLAIVVTI
jgi:hemolysin III